MRKRKRFFMWLAVPEGDGGGSAGAPEGDPTPPAAPEGDAAPPAAPEGEEFDADAYVASLDEEESGAATVEAVQAQLALTERKLEAVTAAYRKLKKDGISVIAPPNPEPAAGAISGGLTEETLKAFLSHF